MRKPIRKLSFSVVVFCLAASVSGAHELKSVSELPSLSTFKRMAADSLPDGWITFQETGTAQVINFSPIMALHCHMKELRYSIDSKDLDQTFPIAPCDPAKPFNLGENHDHNRYTLTLAPGTAQALAVQIIWKDDSKSEIAYYEPCRDVGTAACSYPLEDTL